MSGAIHALPPAVQPGGRAPQPILRVQGEVGPDLDEGLPEGLRKFLPVLGQFIGGDVPLTPPPPSPTEGRGARVLCGWCGFGWGGGPPPPPPPPPPRGGGGGGPSPPPPPGGGGGGGGGVSPPPLGGGGGGGGGGGPPPCVGEGSGGNSA